VDVYPLSSRQKDPYGFSRSPRHVVAIALRIKGELRVDALQGALDDVVERQEALRTRLDYDEADGTQGFGEVQPPMPVALAVRDVPETPGRSHDEAAVELLNALTDDSMSFLDIPSLHATLHRFDEQDAVLTILSHHLHNDGWSAGILRREIAACYRARVTGKPHALPTPVPYREFTAWEQEFLRSEKAETARHYWKTKLAGAEMCALPTDRPYNPETEGPRSAVRNFPIDPDTFAKITASAAQHRCSVWHVFLAAYMVLTEKITGQADLTVLTVNSGRPAREFYDTIGFFANLVPVRLEFDDCETYLDVMLRARKTSADVQQHQLPLESILEMYPALMNPSGDPMALPVGFNYINSPAEKEDTEFTTSVEPVTPPEEQPSSFRRGVFIWTFVAVPAGGFRCVVEYEPDAVDAGTVDRWGADFVDLLVAMTDRPDQSWTRR
jgi:condensation enzyme